MQCKDIPDRPILEFISVERDDPRLPCAFLGFENSVANAMPSGVNEKLVLAKMKGLIKRGLVSGCACGCCGDFEITERGKIFLAETK